MDESNSLASLLGRQSLTPSNPQPVIPVTVNWARISKTKVDGPTHPKDELEQMLEEILDPAKVKTVLQFNKACNPFLATKSIAVSSKSASASLMLASVVDRCADKKQKPFWPKKSLLSIIEKCNVAASSCSPFVLLAIEMKDADVIKCCIDHMQDIPDSTLTRCLQFYIRHFEGASDGSRDATEDETLPPPSSACPLTSACAQCVHFEGASDGSRDATEDETPPPPSSACPLTSACAQCVNKVLCCPFNDTFIIDNLRQFSFDEAMVLLRYLHFLLSLTPANVQDDCTPTLSIVADWISVLLDAHFTQLILSHEARDLLAELAQSVQTQELFYIEMEAVKTVLQSFKDSVSIPAKQTRGIYSIEVLSM